MRWVVCVAFVVVASGCTALTEDDAPHVGTDDPSTSFKLAAPERVSFTMRDGVELVGTLRRPEGIEKAPVVLHAQPYASMCSMPGAPFPSPCVPPTSDDFWLNEYNGLPRALVEAGYTYVDLNVRGTGPSGGCFTINGPAEREDLVEVIDELSRATWSTGAVGMVGLSYMGTTPFVALGEKPPALKAVVAGGILVNEYYAYYTPQGAARNVEDQIYHPMWFGSVAVMPPLGAGPTTAGEVAENYAERACPEDIELIAHPTLQAATEERPRRFFLDRRHIERLGDHEAGVLVVQGLQDRGQGMQIEPLWDALGDTPRAFVLGEWEHRFPDAALLAESAGLDWPDLPIAWFDHYLRDGPTPAVLGAVHHQTSSGSWGIAPSWPALGSEILYVNGDMLAAAPSKGELSFRSDPNGAACSDAPDGTWAAALSEPLAASTLLAGDPMAWLQVQLDEPTATVAVDIWDVAGEELCEGTLLTTGAADLRFLGDPFQGRDVPVGQPVGVRIDLFAVSHEILSGHRIGVTFSSAGTAGATGRPTTATVEIVGGESHLLLPMAGGLGGAPPAIQYPATPLGPEWEP